MKDKRLWSIILVEGESKKSSRRSLVGSAQAEAVLRLHRQQIRVHTPAQQRVLEYFYSTMPKQNFSSDLLVQATLDRLERPERIVDSLSGMGEEPAFGLG